MQQVLAQMLSKYQIRDIGDKKNAIIFVDLQVMCLPIKML